MNCPDSWPICVTVKKPHPPEQETDRRCVTRMFHSRRSPMNWRQSSSRPRSWNSDSPPLEQAPISIRPAGVPDRDPRTPLVGAQLQCRSRRNYCWPKGFDRLRHDWQRYRRIDLCRSLSRIFRTCHSLPRGRRPESSQSRADTESRHRTDVDVGNPLTRQEFRPLTACRTNRSR